MSALHRKIPHPQTGSAETHWDITEFRVGLSKSSQHRLAAVAVGAAKYSDGAAFAAGAVHLPAKSAILASDGNDLPMGHPQQLRMQIGLCFGVLDHRSAEGGQVRSQQSVARSRRNGSQ